MVSGKPLFMERDVSLNLETDGIHMMPYQKNMVDGPLIHGKKGNGKMGNR